MLTPPTDMFEFTAYQSEKRNTCERSAKKDSLAGRIIAKVTMAFGIFDSPAEGPTRDIPRRKRIVIDLSCALIWPPKIYYRLRYGFELFAHLVK